MSEDPYSPENLRLAREAAEAEEEAEVRPLAPIDSDDDMLTYDQLLGGAGDGSQGLGLIRNFSDTDLELGRVESRTEVHAHVQDRAADTNVGSGSAPIAAASTEASGNGQTEGESAANVQNGAAAAALVVSANPASTPMSAGPKPSSSSGSPQPPLPVTIKWSGKEYPLPDISGLKTVGDLKLKIQEKTGVHAERQRLLNLTYMGKPAPDNIHLANLSIKPNSKIMMMGSLEKDIESVDIPPEDRPEITNDLDIPDDDEVEPTESREVYLNKVARRIKEYNVKILNPCRPGKKLLVLDIDYTLFDHRSPASSGVELMRPGLHEFLATAYKEYDIVIWSATSMKWIEEKMRLLNVSSNPAYKIAFYMDYLAMITVHTQKYGVVEVKPLGVIWGKFPQYSNKNTIMFDDLRRNFIMNPQSGLRIRPFRQAHLNRGLDRELFRLSDYLERIATLDDFTTLNHQRWETYLRSTRNRQNAGTGKKPPTSSSSSSS